MGRGSLHDRPFRILFCNKVALSDEKTRDHRSDVPRAYSQDREPRGVGSIKLS